MLGDAQPLTIKTRSDALVPPPERFLLLVFSKGDFRNLNIKQLENKTAIFASADADADGYR